MRKNLIVSASSYVLAFWALLVCTACGADKIVGNGFTQPSQTINTVVYTEPAPNTRSQVVDDNGNQIGVWADLHYVKLVSNIGCPAAGCVEFSIDLGTAPMSNPNVTIHISCGFSMDGQTLASIFAGDGATGQCSRSLKPGQMVPNTMTLGVNPPPPYILILASYPNDGINGPGATGKAIFKIN